MKPKKSLGQNFLRDEAVLDKIIRAADLNESANVIEIGPGEGVLSQELIKQAGKVIMVEKDDWLAEKIARKFQIPNIKYQINSKLINDQFLKKISIINGDILEINLPEIIEKNSFEKYKVVANIPYYITSPIIRLFLETKYPPEEMILMVQKEVAERICADAGQMSILAVSVQYYAEPEILFMVDKESFYPAPEVDSAVIKISNISAKGGSVYGGKNQKIESKKFFRIVHAGFSAKRKTLLNNLSNGLDLDKKVIEAVLKKAGLKPVQRAQELKVADWLNLKKIFEGISLI